MKAVILAGGKGTRGRPYTDYIPKAMIPVDDRPLIGHVLDYVCASDSIDGAVVISDFEGLGAQIGNYLNGMRYGKDVSLIQDSGSGTGGDLLHAARELEGSGEFLLWFVDNLCALDIDGMVSRFKEGGGLACIATRRRRREETGFAVVRDGIVEDFREKPVLELPMAECLGIYVISTRILGMIEERGGSVNLSYDILQGLVGGGNVISYDIGDAEWMDVESPAALERNGGAVRRIIRQMAGPTPPRTGISGPRA